MKSLWIGGKVGNAMDMILPCTKLSLEQFDRSGVMSMRCESPCVLLSSSPFSLYIPFLFNPV